MELLLAAPNFLSKPHAGGAKQDTQLLREELLVPSRQHVARVSKRVMKQAVECTSLGQLGLRSSAGVFFQATHKMTDVRAVRSLCHLASKRYLARSITTTAVIVLLDDKSTAPAFPALPIDGSKAFAQCTLQCLKFRIGYLPVTLANTADINNDILGAFAIAGRTSDFSPPPSKSAALSANGVLDCVQDVVDGYRKLGWHAIAHYADYDATPQPRSY
jgi:hypothetical protein